MLMNIVNIRFQLMPDVRPSVQPLQRLQPLWWQSRFPRAPPGLGDDSGRSGFAPAAVDYHGRAPRARDRLDWSIGVSARPEPGG